MSRAGPAAHNPEEIATARAQPNLEASLEMRAAQVLIAQKLISPENLAAALLERKRVGATLGDVLIAKGGLRAIDYYRALAKAQGALFVDLSQHPVDARLLSAAERRDYADLNLIPWRRSGEIVHIALTMIDDRRRQWAKQRYGVGGYRFVVTSPFDILWQTQSLFRDLDSH